jgi:hypothetical protein
LPEEAATLSLAAAVTTTRCRDLAEAEPAAVLREPPDLDAAPERFELAAFAPPPPPRPFAEPEEGAAALAPEDDDDDDDDEAPTADDAVVAP